jgi:hypothetical protein
MTNFSELAKDHTRLVTKLRRFAFSESACLAAALSLFPSYHANTVRIELLQHFIACCCDGKSVPELNQLKGWCTELQASPLATQEDPVEDVFVGYINSRYGGFRVLRGIISDGDFVVERLLEFISKKPDFPPFAEVIEKVLALLSLSEALVSRINLARYSQGGGEEKSKITPPRWRELKPAADSLHFTDSELHCYSIDKALLEPFFLGVDDRKSILTERFHDTIFEKKPLINDKNGVTVIAPSLMLMAALRSLLNAITIKGLNGRCDFFFKIDSAEYFFNNIAERLKIYPINFHPNVKSEGFPNMYPFYGAFDIGKPVILLSYCTDLSQTANDFTGSSCLNDAEQSAFRRFLRKCTAQLESLPEFSGGMILINLDGAGSNSVLAVPELGVSWQVHMAPLADWKMLAESQECTAIRLWKMGQHEDRLSDYGVKVFSICGVLDKFSCWQQNGWRFISNDVDHREGPTIVLSNDMSEAFRRETRQKHDFHCVLSHQKGRHIRLCRFNPRVYFQSALNDSLYVDFDAAKNGQMIGCIHLYSDRFWVTSPPPIESRPDLGSIIYRLWECCFLWISESLYILPSLIPELNMSSLSVCLEFENIKNWHKDNDLNDTLPERKEIYCSINMELKIIKLVIPEGFLQYFSEPQNTGERLLIEKLLPSMFQIWNYPCRDGEIKRYVEAIVKNDSARRFHVFVANSLEMEIYRSNIPPAVYVEEEDRSFTSFALADLVGRSKEGCFIIGRDISREYLQKIVEKIWERIESKLKWYDQTSVILSCLLAIDGIMCEEDKWDMTAKALFGLHGAEHNVDTFLINKRSERSEAKTGHFALIEIAQYCCSNETGNALSLADHHVLLADVSLMILLAQMRDAIANGFIESRVQIYANGEIDTDRTFHELSTKYLTAKSKKITDYVVSEADSYYWGKKKVSMEGVEEYCNKQDQVFIPEYGFSMSKMFLIGDQLRDRSIQEKKSFFIMNEQEMKVLLSTAGLSSVEAQAFLARFTLPVRTSWNTGLPSGCRDSDVFLWRHRRKMSFLSRPLMELSSLPKSWIVSATAFDRTTQHLFIRIDDGNIQHNYFNSEEMRSRIGEIVNKLGHEFARDVEAVAKEAGFKTDLEVEMTSLGAKKSDGLGDVDVLAWKTGSLVVYVVECKRLRSAITTYDIIQRLEDFKNDKKEKNSLTKHIRRCDWLSNNRAALSKLTGIDSHCMEIRPLLVTSDIVPMQFFEDYLDFSSKNVVFINNLEMTLNKPHVPPKRRKKEHVSK